MRRKRLFVLVMIFVLIVLGLFLGCSQQETVNDETSIEGAQIISISLICPYRNYTIRINENQYLTTVTRNENGEEIQKNIQLSDREFAKIHKKMNRLDFSSPPKTRVDGMWDVGLYSEMDSQSAFFTYGYYITNRKTDKPFVDFVKTIVKLSPIPIVNSLNQPIRSFVLPF